MKTDSYSLIKLKCNNRNLNSEERKQLSIDLRHFLKYFIKTIEEACPSLTAEDVIFCCLFKLRIDNSFIFRCMGNVGKQPVNQRKYRIKKKMEEAKCVFLFELIFNN